MYRPKIHPKQKKKKKAFRTLALRFSFPPFFSQFPKFELRKKIELSLRSPPFWTGERERERQIDGDGGCADRNDSRARIPSNEKTCWCTSFSVEFKSKDADLSKRHDQAFDKNRRNSILRLCPPRARARARQKREPKRWERHVNECNAQNVTTTYHLSERQGCPCTSSPSCSLIRKENVTTSIVEDVSFVSEVFLELFFCPRRKS